MTTETTCWLCGALESGTNPLDRMTRLIGGLVMPPRATCRDEDACNARRVGDLPQTYSGAHQAVVAARRTRITGGTA